jgi:hypothetical protein
MTGQPSGAPRWPRRGGLLRQTNRLFQACQLLRAEWPRLSREAEKTAAKPAKEAGPES